MSQSMAIDLSKQPFPCLCFLWSLLIKLLHYSHVIDFAMNPHFNKNIHCYILTTSLQLHWASCLAANGTLWITFKYTFESTYTQYLYLMKFQKVLNLMCDHKMCWYIAGKAEPEGHLPPNFAFTLNDHNFSCWEHISSPLTSSFLCPRIEQGSLWRHDTLDTIHYRFVHVVHHLSWSLLTPTIVQ